MMEFETFATYIGFSVDLCSLPKAIYWCYWYLHCSRYCVKQIANGLVLSKWKGKDSVVDTLLAAQKELLAEVRAAHFEERTS